MTKKGGRGHLYVRIMVQVPTGDEPELIELAERLDEFYVAETDD